MGRLGLALKILFNGTTARQVAEAIKADAVNRIEAAAQPVSEPPVPQPARSDAITVLAALQRDARFVDFVLEPIDGYSDAQVGAAVREVHRGCSDVIQRMFSPVAIIDQAEDSTAEVSNAASGLYRLTGNVSQSSGSVSGKLAHHGWVAKKCSVPEWSGDDEAINVIGPAEIHVS